MFIPTINVKRPDGSTFSVIGRLYTESRTGQTFHIIQHPDGQAGFLDLRLITILAANMPALLNFLEWIRAHG